MTESLKYDPDLVVVYLGNNEYYGAFGPLTGFDPAPLQEQQLFGAVDLNVSPRWEINLGVGRGFTASTDRWLLKTIVGYRLGS